MSLCKRIYRCICNLKYSVPKRISIVFHNESNYDYHFIIKEVTEEFEKQFTWLGENTVSIEKEVTRIDKNGEQITKNISYVLLVRYQILPIIILKDFVEFRQEDKKCNIYGIKLLKKVLRLFSWI